MGIFINLPLTLCTLCLVISLSSGKTWTTGDNSQPKARETRSVNRPIPVNCRMGNWAPWTPCTSCTNKQFRYRNLEKPSQFGGTECYETQWDKTGCPTTTDQCVVPDYCGESFTCSETGRCIGRSLLCNGEPDCEDYSDEDDCVDFNRRNDKCSTILPIPGVQRGTQGYNVVTDTFMAHVLDSNYFGGKCEYVYNGDWKKFVYDSFCENLRYKDDEKNYRKPYNYHAYRFVAEATSEGSEEYYEDMLSMLRARKEMSSSNGGVTVAVYYVEAGLSGSRESEFLKNVSQHNTEETGFVRLTSKVQTAHFKMRSDKLMLNEDFYTSLMDLPEEYDFGMYSRFFNTYGTHYVTEGTMGGTLEYVLVVNKTSMKSSNLEGKQAGGCLGASIGLSYPVTESVTLGFKLGTNPCRKKGSFNQGTEAASVVIEDIISQVKGGILEQSSGVVAIKSPDTYRKWGESLKYNPALIEYETLPIYELVRFSTAADHVGARLANLRTAYDEYLKKFDSCRCLPCQHNGLTVFSGSNCKCLCKSGYQGQACEETLRKDTKTDGAWSCWTDWLPCNGQRKTRTRTCNNPEPLGGGKPCIGSSSQTKPC